MTRLRGLFAAALGAVWLMVGVRAIVAQAPTMRYAVVLAAESDTAALLPAVKRWNMGVAFRDGVTFALTGRPGLLDSLRTLRRSATDTTRLCAVYCEFDQSTPGGTQLPPDSAALLSGPLEVGQAPWNLEMLRAPEVWARGIDGTGVRIGIMDSGVDCAHPQFAGRLTGRDFTGSNPDPSVCAAWTDRDCNSHGTHVAGSAASTDYGVAPGAEVVALRVFQSINGSCGSWNSAQYAALSWAADNGIRVVNYSGGGGWTGNMQALTQLIGRRGSTGTLLVAAAGNDGGTAIAYPAGFAYALGVGAVTSSGARASYSQRGNNLDVAAPGSGIVSTMPGNRTGSKSGTSMASPHVAGVVALMLQREPSLTVQDIQHVLAVTAQDKGAAGRDALYGWGIVDAAAADSAVMAGERAPEPVWPVTGFAVARGTGGTVYTDTLPPPALRYDGWTVETEPAAWDQGVQAIIHSTERFVTLRLTWAQVPPTLRQVLLHLRK